MHTSKPSARGLLRASCAVLLFISAVAQGKGIRDIKTGKADGQQEVTGVVTLVEPFLGFFMAEGPNPFQAIYVDQSDYGPEIGDLVQVKGRVENDAEYIHLADITALEVISRGNPVYPPISTDAGTLRADLIAGPNSLEGCLVTIRNATVTNPFIGYRGYWRVHDETGGLLIGDNLDYNYFPKARDTFDAISGVVIKTSEESFILQPRFTSDLSAAPNIIPHYALHGTIVTMDEQRRVLTNAWLVIQHDLIVAITNRKPAGIRGIDVNGLLFPALISTHDHLSYGLWDFIPFDIPPYFKDRDEWAELDEQPPGMYRDFKLQRNEFMDMFDQIVKLVEVRMASSGCAVTQSQTFSFSRGENTYAKLGVGIINGERFPGRVYNRVLRITDMGPEAWAEKQREAERGKYHRFNLHLAETTDGGVPEMVNQWEQWKSFDSFAGYDTILHGINIPPGDFALFHHPTGRRTVLCWSPKSNMLLYNETADIQAALDHGVPVALAPDWTPSGMPNMLAELNFAISVARAKGWNITPVQYADMLTRNAAEGFGQLDRMGSIEVGKQANVMVIEKRKGLDPYQTLLAIAGDGRDPDYRGGPRDVRLTIVAGRPVYGDPDLVTRRNFPFLRKRLMEELTICGKTKTLALARHNAGAYPGVDELFSDLYRALWDRYQEGRQAPAAFLPVDPCGTLPWAKK